MTTVTLLNVIDAVMPFGDISRTLNQSAAGYRLALTIANDVMADICNQPTPWKWNEILIPQFYTNSWQQDYAIPGLTNLSWLQRGIVVNINSTSTPKPWGYIRTVKDQTQSTSAFVSPFFSSPVFIVNWLPNNQLYYGTWGAANTGNATFGNNPVAGSIYTNPLGQSSMPANPITQIQDANGNLLVLTTYGTEGSAAPVLPANSNPGTTISGTGASTQWTVVSPVGMGFRINPAPSQTGVVWQFNLVGQAVPVRFLNPSQLLAPLPDDWEPHFRAGFIAQCYRYSPDTKVREKFRDEYNLWLASLMTARAKTDREPDEYGLVPERSVVSGGGGGFAGPAWPFAGPPGV